MTAHDYMLHVLDAFGPTAAAIVAERLADDHADDIVSHGTGGAATQYARTVVAGYVVDREQERLADDPDMWYGVTTDEAHEIRAAIIRDVAEQLVRVSFARADERYDAANYESDWELSRRFARSLVRGSRVL